MVGDLFDPKVNGHACPDDLIRAVQQEANNNNSSFSFDDDDLDLDDTKAALSAKPEVRSCSLTATQTPYRTALVALVVMMAAVGLIFFLHV